MRQRGMTLIEMAVVAGIIALVAMAVAAVTQGCRLFAIRSSIAQFDAALAYAQSLAASGGNGATLVFQQRVQPDGSVAPGFVLSVYRGRPSSKSSLSAGSLAPVAADADVAEAKMGVPPFTIFLDSAQHASGMRGAVLPGTVVPSDPGCPPGETAISLTFSDSRVSRTRILRCNGAVSGAPVALGTAAP